MKTQHIFIIILYISCSIIFISCSSNPPSQTINTSIIGKYWKLTELNGEEVVFEPSFRRQPHIIFYPENRFSGHGGCNSFSGSYELKTDNRILIPPFVSTQIACINMDIENVLMTILLESYSFLITNNETELTLFNSNKIPFARFEVVYFE